MDSSFNDSGSIFSSFSAKLKKVSNFNGKPISTKCVSSQKEMNIVVFGEINGLYNQWRIDHLIYSLYNKEKEELLIHIFKKIDIIFKNP